MDKRKEFVHPYIPNSVGQVKARMLKEIGAESIEELSKNCIRSCYRIQNG